MWLLGWSRRPGHCCRGVPFACKTKRQLQRPEPQISTPACGRVGTEADPNPGRGLFYTSTADLDQLTAHTTILYACLPRVNASTLSLAPIGLARFSTRGPLGAASCRRHGNFKDSCPVHHNSPWKDGMDIFQRAVYAFR